jgi:basic membrane lipoprotein Med (substrate-binding protein (PBP1-ABC) superfamily)
MIYMKNKSLMTALARMLVISVVVALVLMGTTVRETSRTRLVAGWHFDGDVKDSNWNENGKSVYGRTVINIQR